MEAYVNERDKNRVYKCTTCGKISSNPKELMKHAIIFNHYYKPSLIHVEDE